MNNEYKDQYWHCYVKVLPDQKERDYHVVNDLSFDELKKTIINPWHANKPFTVAGNIIRSSTDISKIQIINTEFHKQLYVDEYNNGKRRAGILDMATNRNLIPFRKGKDYTYELLFEDKKELADDDQLELVQRLCKRLKKSAQLLCNRTRKGKESYNIEDEYDVQDLLHSLLRGFLKYSVTEDPIGKTAGSKSARADISIEELGIIIEVKYVRTPIDQKKLFKEYSEDLLLYSKWEHLKSLIFFIYNSDDLADGEALEKLSGKHSLNGKDFDSFVILG